MVHQSKCSKHILCLCVWPMNYIYLQRFDIFDALNLKKKFEKVSMQSHVKCTLNFSIFCFSVFFVSNFIVIWFNVIFRYFILSNSVCLVQNCRWCKFCEKRCSSHRSKWIESGGAVRINEQGQFIFSNCQLKMMHDINDGIYNCYTSWFGSFFLSRHV